MYIQNITIERYFFKNQPIICNYSLHIKFYCPYLANLDFLGNEEYGWISSVWSLKSFLRNYRTVSWLISGKFPFWSIPNYKRALTSCPWWMKWWHRTQQSGPGSSTSLSGRNQGAAQGHSQGSKYTSQVSKFCCIFLNAACTHHWRGKMFLIDSHRGYADL